MPDVEYNVMVLAYMIEVDSDTIVVGVLQVYNQNYDYQYDIMFRVDKVVEEYRNSHD